MRKPGWSSVSVLALSTGLAAILITVMVLVAQGDDTTTTASSTSAAVTSMQPAPTSLVAPLASAPSAATTETTPPSSTSPVPSRDRQPAMTMTIDLAPEAVWDDGSPITAADLRCTWQANANTPGSIGVGGYDRITSVRAGEDRRQVVVSFSEPYAPYRDLFDAIIKADTVEDCNDVSADFQTGLPFSGGPYRLQEWSLRRSVLVPNPNYRGEAPEVERVVIAAAPDPLAGLAAFARAEVDFVRSRFVAGIEEALSDPNVETVRGYAGDYEALYFEQLNGPLADPTLREALWKSIDLDALYDVVYGDIVAGRPRLTCGPVVLADYCPTDAFDDTFDPDGAAALLEEAGWTRDADGYWAKDGVVPEIRWMVNAGDARRETAQAYLIPLLGRAGFKVVADNCVAECVFEQRLPALDYDIAMYASTAPPDPGYLTFAFTCANVPSIDNDYRGQNQQGWCNEEASELLERADVTVDADERAQMITDAVRLMAVDHVLLPLSELPQVAAHRTDRVGGAIEDEQGNYRAFEDFSGWTDVDGDGEIVISAEQWPGCLNPVTECAESPWYRRTVAAPLLPSVWAVTDDGGYETTDLVTGEPVVEVFDEAAEASE